MQQSDPLITVITYKSIEKQTKEHLPRLKSVLLHEEENTVSAELLARDELIVM